MFIVSIGRIVIIHTVLSIHTRCRVMNIVLFIGSNGRLYTVSIALPGSIISNAQNLQMKTYLVGQVCYTCV